MHAALSPRRAVNDSPTHRPWARRSSSSPQHLGWCACNTLPLRFDTRAAGDATHFLFVLVSRPCLFRPPQRRDASDFGLLLVRRRGIALATSDSRSGPPPCVRSVRHPSLGCSRPTRHGDAMAPRRPLLLATRAHSRRFPLAAYHLLAACHLLTARQPASARRSL
jgi:hypothetical protein